MFIKHNLGLCVVNDIINTHKDTIWNQNSYTHPLVKMFYGIDETTHMKVFQKVQGIAQR